MSGINIFILLFFWVIMVAFCISLCFSNPNMQRRAVYEVDDSDTESFDSDLDIEIVTVIATPMTPRSASQCVHKIVLP